MWPCLLVWWYSNWSMTCPARKVHWLQAWMSGQCQVARKVSNCLLPFLYISHRKVANHWPTVFKYYSWIIYILQVLFCLSIAWFIFSLLLCLSKSSLVNQSLRISFLWLPTMFICPIHRQVVFCRRLLMHPSSIPPSPLPQSPELCSLGVSPIWSSWVLLL